MPETTSLGRWRSHVREWEKSTGLPSINLKTGSSSSLRYCTYFLRRFGYFLVPSFLQGRLGRHSTPRRIAATAYLDGLRGAAALFVAIDHTMSMFHTSLRYGYVIGVEGRTWFFQLPVIRLVHTGSAMVAIFFVVSGYVSSLKPLKLIQARDYTQLQKTMCSSIFRRGLRLYLPALATSFITMLLTSFGFFIYDHSFPFPDYPAAHQLDTLYNQFSHWIQFVGNFVSPWDWSGGLIDLRYGFHLWTIPVEYRCSMLLSVVTMGLARLHWLARLSLLSVFIIYSLECGRWDVFLFLSGMFIGETNLLAQQSNTEAALPQREDREEQKVGKYKTRWRKSQLFWTILFLAGLYLMNQPQDGAAQSPGYIYLNAIIPRRIPEGDRFRFWVAIGAVLLVWSMSFLGFLQKLFTNPVALYLGDISYALYLIHIVVMRCLAYRIMPITWSLTGFETPYQYELGYILGMVVIAPLIIVVADMTWRLIDVPCVDFSRWLESKLVIV